MVALRDIAGNEYEPEDYLTAFARFVRQNEAKIEAIRVLLDRPRDWSGAAHAEVQQKLAGSRYYFTGDNLEPAHRSR